MKFDSVTFKKKIVTKPGMAAVEVNNSDDAEPLPQEQMWKEIEKINFDGDISSIFEVILEILFKYLGFVKVQYEGELDKVFQENVIEECKKLLLLREVEADIPKGILPEDYEGKLIDTKIRARGPDDEKYEKYEILRHFINGQMECSGWATRKLGAKAQ